jgi:hypothetical protein
MINAVQMHSEILMINKNPNLSYIMIKGILTIPARQCRIPTQLPVKYPELGRVFKEASRN